jgi:glycosyltransferase involved in cell wall biosynthesis
MNILQLTPGAGSMYCGNCMRDNALVAALRDLGHQVLMVPLYLPLTLDETDQSAGTPVFFSGINVYLDQKSSWFRKAPRWLHHLFALPTMLKLAARQSSKTRVESLGPLTLSMLLGEAGNQAPELADLVTWLKSQPAPDVIFLSNALLLGLARQLKDQLRRPVVCMLQGEDFFLDSLPEPDRTECWSALAQRAKDADLFVAPSRYFAKVMGSRLELPAERLRVVYNGIQVEGYSEPNIPLASAQASAIPNSQPGPPILGYLARMCREKGLETLVRTFVEVRRRGHANNLKLCVAGSLGPADQPFVRDLQKKLVDAGLGREVSFYSNVDRSTKLKLLRSFSVFCVPALYGEAFGLYVIEALAAGVPVVQPRTAAFTELIELTGGGLLCEPDSFEELAAGIEQLLLDPTRARTLGAAGRRVVFEKFSAEAMARNLLDAIKPAVSAPRGTP